MTQENPKPKQDDEIVYKGHLTLVRRLHEGKKFDVVVSKDAAAMLYIDENDIVYLAKQYRPAQEKELLEAPAETLDKPSLSPLEVMIEGLEEECGIKIGKNQVKYFGKLISTSGHDTEKVHLFLAYGKGEKTKQRLEDSEKINVVKMPFDELYKMVINNEVEGSKLSCMVMYEKLRRHGLI